MFLLLDWNKQGPNGKTALAFDARSCLRALLTARKINPTNNTLIGPTATFECSRFCS
jgi:hypothetical protein